jgi:RNA polymerase sigma factor (sigma-70 family)
MKSTNDLDLLRKFTRDQSQDAFTTLVQRHLNLVYCAGLRQVRSPQLAEDVAQSVFIDLARNAARLKPDTILTAWLYEVTRRTAINVVRGEARRRLREQIAVEMNAMNANADDWTQIEPLLDDAMHALDDADRTAVLLRFFENKSLREVGELLGTTDDTARKRVNRAVERLRDFFAKRGVNVGVSGLVGVISTHAVQAAPAGLVATVSTAAALAGTTVLTTATATASKTLVVTSLQKALTIVIVAASLGAPLVIQHRRQTKLGEANQSLRKQLDQQTALAAETKRRLDAMAAPSRTNPQSLPRDQLNELLRLRGEVGRLRNEERELKARLTEQGSDPALVARIKLPYAEVELARATQLHAGNLVSDDQLREAQYAAELLRAEAKSDLQEAARLRLGHAESNLHRISELHRQGLVGEAEFNKATYEVELRQAEQNGDRAEVMRTRLRQAEKELQRVSELYEGKLISDDELSQARMNVELLRAQITP